MIFDPMNETFIKNRMTKLTKLTKSEMVKNVKMVMQIFIQ